ncbi:two-component system sensor histidine kinase DesK [Kibdelosporangium banguiense]|uniref:Two-component system sensor histidine kinase DesK n=1 Tax=Kibdelosporangium banguiense TaxID=1365924 RepID=A0ABS4T9H0_9PSEU|nr:two-component system sensor histidine kinase DesK [Kibdelosporangium banguiense]
MNVEMDLADDQVRAMWNRRLWSRFVLMYLALTTSAVIYLAGSPPPWQAVLVLLGAFLTAVLGMRTTFNLTIPWLGRLPFWPSYAVLVVLCLTLPAVAGSEWAFNSAWASAATGWIGGRWVAGRLLAIGAVVGVVAWQDDLEPAMIAWLALIGMLVGFFTSQARRQYDMFEVLQASRRERARLAVADERDRIARDLHDLVGHSLSVIAVKTELARRLVLMDPEKAEKELADIDTVVRRALAEVRQAVTNYRQPTLAGELASARRAAASAGIDCRVESPDSWSLPAPVDGALAWTVREGVTNVLRHSRASNCTIKLSLMDCMAEVAIVDDGVGPGTSGRGNGLRGLSERAEALGGSMTSGQSETSGFYVKVRVPA